MYSNDHLYQGIDNDPKTFFCIYAISIIIHLIFICALLFAPDFTLHDKPSASVINVSLVSLPEKKILQKSARSKKIYSKSSTELAVNTVKKSAKAVSLGKKKKRVKKSLKKRTYKPEGIRKKPLKKKSLQQIKQKVEQTKQDPLAEAFERLREEVKKSEAGEQKNKEPENNVRGENFNAISGKKKLELINIYMVEVAYQVQKNWAFSKQLSGGRTDLSAEIAFKIMPDGEIRDIWFDKRSDNIYFDESVKKAILKSNPVRPHPKGSNRPYINLGLRFTPEGVM